MLHNFLSRPLSFLGWTTAMPFWLDFHHAQSNLYKWFRMQQHDWSSTSPKEPMLHPVLGVTLRPRRSNIITPENSPSPSSVNTTNVACTITIRERERERGSFQEWWYYCAEVEVLQSALPPHIIVIIFIRLENRHVLFCVTILTRVTTHVNVFK